MKTNTHQREMKEFHAEIQQAKIELKGRNFGNTIFLSQRLKISKYRASMIFRALGWPKHSKTGKTTVYKRIGFELE